MDGYIGEMKMFVGTFAPMNWEFCWGQQLPIRDYNSLYAIIGTQFGGDGVNYFNVPDMRGRTPIGAGSGPNLTPRTQGQKGGAEAVTLTTTQLPAHTHTVKCDNQTSGQVSTPSNSLPSVISSGTVYATGTTGSSTMNANMITSVGSGQAHDNMSPWGCINYIICTQGIWPPQS